MLRVDRRVSVRGVAALLAVTFASTLAVAQIKIAGQDEAEPSQSLTPDELAAEPAFNDSAAESFYQEPVLASDVDEVKIAPVPENGGYFDEKGRYVVDIMSQDYAYIAIRVETPEGVPVEEAEPTFSMEGTSQLLEPEAVMNSSTTDQYGIVEFAVVAGEMGLDRISVEYGDVSTEVMINVISRDALAYSLPTDGEGYLSWDELMQAQVRYEDMTLFADFPEAVSERSGETVTVAGFMMPLQAGMTQEWFLLTTHPPGCFFHVPGGPSGAVEVFAKEGIEVSWDPVVLEGRFEALEESESAVYQLHDARLASQ